MKLSVPKLVLKILKLARMIYNYYWNSDVINPSFNLFLWLWIKLEKLKEPVITLNKLKRKIIQFLLKWGNLRPVRFLRQHGFTYSACGQLTKSKERIQNFKESFDILILFKIFLGDAQVKDEEGGREEQKDLLLKICHIYPTMKKFGTVIPYLNKIKKIFESRDIPLEFWWH